MRTKANFSLLDAHNLCWVSYDYMRVHLQQATTKAIFFFLTRKAYVWMFYLNIRHHLHKYLSHRILWVSCVNIRRHSLWWTASPKMILPSLPETFDSTQKFGFECVLIRHRSIHINWQTRKLFDFFVKLSAPEGIMRLISEHEILS